MAGRTTTSENGLPSPGKLLAAGYSLVWPPLLFLAIFLTLWEIAVDREWISSLILPTPVAVAESFVSLITSSFIWGDIWATSYAALMGFFLASAFGIGLAIVCGLFGIWRRMLFPFIITLQVTPRIAIAPILIAWLGFGYTPKIVLAATIAFFPVFVNALAGIDSVDRESREMFRSLGASRRRTLFRLTMPSSLPIIFAGLKTAMTLALIGAVVGEFISADAGLGLLVSRFSNQLAMDDALAVVFILTLLGLVLYAIIAYLDRTICFWLHDGRMSAKTRRRVARSSRRQGVATAGAAALVSTGSDSDEPKHQGANKSDNPLGGE